MNESRKQVYLGALLHDTGKLFQRADQVRVTHADYAVTLLEEEKILSDEDRILKDCIWFHHWKDLKNASLPKDHPAWIIYEADNIASGVDRRKKDDSETRFDPETPLATTFSLLWGKDGSDKAYQTQSLSEKKGLNYPQENRRADASRYQALKAELLSGLHRMSLIEESPDSLLELMEATTSFIPASTNTSEYSDISLYDHSRITAAVAGSLHAWLAEKQLTDYRENCFIHPENIRKQPVFRLVSGDFSGIQSFIYTISSKGALKSLKARSFSLEIMLEHLVDEILADCHACRTHLLYSGGGHFYMILANTDQVANTLAKAKKRINDFLLDEFGIDLYLALESVPCSPSDFMDREQGGMTLFGKLANQLNNAKKHRYNEQQLRRVFYGKKELDEDRECSVCRVSHQLSHHQRMESDVCPVCSGLYSLGDDLAGLNRKQDDNTASTMISVVKGEKGFSLPLLTDDEAVLQLTSLQQTRSLIEENDRLVRCYSVNQLMSGVRLAKNLWAGTYYLPSPDGYGLANFQQLAEASSGINRLAVLRADVDNLGTVFANGLNHPGRYSLSRQSTLSRMLSLFFKRYINDLCRMKPRGEKNPIQGFRLDNKESDSPRNVALVYSGGDDLFAVGAWDDIVGFAIDLRESFREFTEGQLTLSAGIGMFHAGYPIARMAELTGRLEKAAKDYPGKDAVAFSGFDDQQMNPEESVDESLSRVFSWDDFIGNVLTEKMEMLRRWFVLSEEAGEARGKLVLSTAQTYRLITLYRSIAGKDSFNIARLAYVLARMDPGKKTDENTKALYREMRDTLYEWAQDKEQTRQFLMALELKVYLNRKKKGRDD